MPGKKGSGKNRARRGRPSLYTDELAKRIVELYASGMTLQQIGQMDGMPSHRTVNRWLLKNHDFSVELSRARAARVYAMFDEGEEQLRGAESHEEVAKAREMLAHARWSAKVHHPKEFGDRREIDLNATGEMGVLVVPAEQTEEEWLGEKDRGGVELPTPK